MEWRMQNGECTACNFNCSQTHATTSSFNLPQPDSLLPLKNHPQVAAPQRTAEITIYIYVPHFYDGIFHIFLKFNAHLVKLPPRNYVHLNGKQFARQ